MLELLLIALVILFLFGAVSLQSLATLFWVLLVVCVAILAVRGLGRL